MQELEKREDAGTVMVQLFMEESLKPSFGKYGSSIILIQLDALLIQDIYKSKLTNKEAFVYSAAWYCYINQYKWHTITVPYDKE